MPEKNTSSDANCIAMLTDAEKRARAIIEAAKKRKAVFMKKAKEDSTEEIEIFRKQSESSLDKLYKEYSSGQESDAVHLEENFEKKKAIMFEEFKLNYVKTLDFIIKSVNNVEPVAHENLVI